MNDSHTLVVDENDHDDEHPQDLKGCLFFALRTTGCMLWLYVTMFAAIFFAAIISLIFQR